LNDELFIFIFESSFLLASLVLREVPILLLLVKLCALLHHLEHKGMFFL